MTTLQLFLREIDAFCREAAISESTFSRRVANDGKFVGRLKEGADLTVGTMDRVRKYMAEQRKVMADEARRQRRRKAA